MAARPLRSYLSVAPDGSLLLGNPRLAYGCLGDPALHVLGTFPLALQRAYRREYERIAAHLRQVGFRVRRLPILHAAGGTIITWNNVAFRDGSGRTRAFVPHYGAGTLERRAHAAWRRRGVSVSPIATDAVIHLGGAVRCLTNSIRSPTDD